MFDWRRIAGALVVAVASSACAATQTSDAPRVLPRDGAAMSKRAEQHLALRAPRPLTPAAETTARAAVEPESAPVERRRCELAHSRDTAGFYPTDAWPSGQVVLTFDDGPHPGKTPKVLDLLAKHRMPATFFVVGRAISKKTYRLVQRMVAEGHTLGSHSYNHDVEMAQRQLTERTIEYIRGQHETTEILIEIALLAKDDADFDGLYARVFGKKAGVWLSSTALRTDWPVFAARHAEVLEERGYTGGARPYPIVHSRPPGGGPYLVDGTRAQRELYATAMQRLGYLNVMWNGESGDTNPKQKHDHAFLTQNLRYHSKKGGILLIHDYIRTDALTVALERMAKDPGITVVPIEQVVEQKYRCSTAELREALLQPRGAVAFTRQRP